MVQQALTSLYDPNVNGFAPMVEYPGDNCCTIYDDWYYGRAGDRTPSQDPDSYRQTYCVNDGQRTVHNLHADGWGDRMQSYYCGKNVWFDFCNDGEADCYGAYRSNSGAGHQKNWAVRYHANQASTLIMGPYDPRQIGAVTFFEDGECTGGTGRFYWNPDSEWSSTYYNLEDMIYGGSRNNSMHSLMVPKGYTAYLYANDSFDGRVQVVEGAYKDKSEEMVCVRAEFGDGVSSLEIRRQEQGAAQAYWQSVTSTESLEQTYHIGLTYSKVENKQWEEADRMNSALDLGITFLSIFFPPLSLIPRQRNVVQKDVTTTYGYDYSQASTTTCTVPDGSAGGAGLWQWVVATQDGQTMSFTQHTVCRTGDLWNVEPSCPYFACANADCSECLDGWKDI